MTNISTIDPKNRQTIYSLNFHNFELESLRLPTAGLFIEKGIFTTDRPFWEHSRALVRSIFTRAQFADLETLEHHVKQMMDLIPGDGSSLDILPLLSKLVRAPRCPQKHTFAEQDQFLDTSTAFLFGESVNSFSFLSKSTIDAKYFLSAFTVAQEGASKKIRQGKLRIFSEIRISRQQRKQSVPLRRVMWTKHLPYVGC